MCPNDIRFEPGGINMEFSIKLNVDSLQVPICKGDLVDKIALK